MVLELLSQIGPVSTHLLNAHTHTTKYLFSWAFPICVTISIHQIMKGPNVLSVGYTNLGAPFARTFNYTGSRSFTHLRQSTSMPAQ